MRRRFEIPAGEKYTFVAGQTDNFFILRDSSANITLESDLFKGVVLTRSDTVVITDYQQMELRLFNQSNETIFGEIQLSEVDIRIKEQRINIEDTVTVDEILKPVTVQKIIEPVVVDKILKPVVIAKEEVKYNFSKQSLSGNEKWSLTPLGTRIMQITSIQVVADMKNKGEIGVMGDIRLPAGACWSVDRKSGITEIWFQGSTEDKLILFFTYEMRPDVSRSYSEDELWTVTYERS